MYRAVRSSSFQSLALAIWVLASHAFAKDRAVITWPTVNLQINVEDGVPIRSELVAEGEDIASMVYSRVHVRLSWQSRQVKGYPLIPETCALGRTTTGLIIKIALHAPPTVSNSALAIATPYARSGLRIVVFYDRVEPLLRGHSATQGSILGYVLAHEIGHMLQGTSRHSEVGVMKARWTDNDFSQMGRGLVTFTEEDQEQIHLRLADDACRERVSKPGEPLNSLMPYSE